MAYLGTYCEIPYVDPVHIFDHLEKQHPHSIIFLDSNSTQNFPTGRYSYIAVDPLEIIDTPDLTAANPFDGLHRFIDKNNPTIPGLPPFQGGIAGYFGYELLHYLENVPLVPEQNPTMHLPVMRFGVYDVVFSFDHVTQKAYIVSAYGDERLAFAKALLTHMTQPSSLDTPIEAPLDTLSCDFTADEFQQAVQKTIDYIYAGDIFQANMTRRLHGTVPSGTSLAALYQRLRTLNPAPFGGYFAWRKSNNDDGRDYQQAILSSSPERFIELSPTGHIETRPIKGTRKRDADQAIDQAIQAELQACTKDRAENTMIVDLMRNDLSRVCEPFSVKVPKLCALETYETVHHLVSVVEGQLRPDLNAIDVIKATFPGGSITGAPKVRAMEIISELERASRGPYCGCLGYIGFNGAMDTNIMIRTLVVDDNVVSYHVGGGIVADSEPLNEFEETVTKGRALQKTLIGSAVSLKEEGEIENSIPLMTAPLLDIRSA